VITFERFSKRFGLVDAVVDLDVSVKAGEVVALLGPNGSGKTTSIKAAAGLIHPSSGRVLIGDDRRPAIDPLSRRQCAFLPQRVAFPDGLTGRQVIAFYARLRGVASRRAADVLDVTGLAAAASRPVSTYSGGMTQRLALAVAMLPDAAVLLLDEPTAALDPQGLDVFYRLIDDGRAKGQTVLFSSHQMNDVRRIADRSIVLDNTAANGVVRCA
jgi:Cu-processing system ATP-binding protein